VRAGDLLVLHGGLGDDGKDVTSVRYGSNRIGLEYGCIVDRDAVSTSVCELRADSLH
jgi:hypothetical protein